MVFEYLKTAFLPSFKLVFYYVFLKKYFSLFFFFVLKNFYRLQKINSFVNVRPRISLTLIHFPWAKLLGVASNFQ